MSKPAKIEAFEPPRLRFLENGDIETNTLADLLEWFLMYDERTARIRHASIDEVFRWKQQDDKANGMATYPFENAEARFAIGAFQALAENNSEATLSEWISRVLEALRQSHEVKREIADSYGIDSDMDAFALAKADLLPTANEKRLYLTSCWIEALCTAEARFLGYVYQEKYGRPFAA
jgi:hypothetical protein